MTTPHFCISPGVTLRISLGWYVAQNLLSGRKGDRRIFSCRCVWWTLHYLEGLLCQFSGHSRMHFQRWREGIVCSSGISRCFVFFLLFSFFLFSFFSPSSSYPCTYSCVLTVDRFLHTSITLWPLAAAHRPTQYGAVMDRCDRPW